jgi:hypothetical protein
MKILIDSEIEQAMLQGIRNYSRISFLSAWAGTKFTAFRELNKHSKKIIKVVVGLSFNGTEPDFIERFIKNPKIKYIKEHVATFHPKLYLFENSESEWVILIGSANFTYGAFLKNTEIMMLISSTDPGVGKTYNKTVKLIDYWWKKGEAFNRLQLDKYRKDYENSKNNKQKSTLFFPGVKVPQPEAKITNMTWKECLKKMKRNSRKHSYRLEASYDFMHLVHSALKESTYDKLETRMKKAIAGIIDYYLDNKGIEYVCGYFGTMGAAGKFMHVLNENTKKVSEMINKIPISGKVEKKHYERFIEKYEKIFGLTEKLPGPTRFLTIIRPDIFVSVNGKNIDLLSKDFGFKPKDLNVLNYWEFVVEKMQKLVWFNKPPNDKFGKKLFKYRAAMLDAMYYQY